MIIFKIILDNFYGLNKNILMRLRNKYKVRIIGHYKKWKYYKVLTY